MDGPSTLTPMAYTPTQPSSGAPRSLTGLLPFLRPYRARIALSVVFLVLAALATLAFPLALRNLVDGGLVNPDKGAQTMALRNHFEALFAVAVALGVFSAARFYMVSWLGERVTADLRNAVYAHVVEQSPEFFETTQTGEVLSRLTGDTTLIQTVVGSSASVALRNLLLFVGDLATYAHRRALPTAAAIGRVPPVPSFRTTTVRATVSPGSTIESASPTTMRAA